MMHPIFRHAQFLKCIGLTACILGVSFVPVNAQVSATASVERQASDSTTLIHIGWDASDAIQWHKANDGRLDRMGLQVQLNSSALAQTEATRYQFDFNAQVEVEFLIDISERQEGEQLYLMEKRNGRMILDLMAGAATSMLTPSFNPAETILVWKGVGTAPRQTRFTLRNIYVGEIHDRQLDIGFGTALACHPNAACKTDSLIKLISNSVVRMRMVMEEGIGWCSGTFVNNTRQDKTPFILSAYHCQYDYTPLYDMWRFDLHYASALCENPATEPAYLSLTGCQLIAGGQASDFLLVQLLEPVPLNTDVTFSGWDRDESLIPDTVFHIHHPNADIRKFSSCTQGIVLHPNQIGWSEGYTTPANHHLRFKFTEGGHEPGSSGGPIFNTDGHLVAQLHGGTAGCEITNNTFAGRLAKSWDLGQTPQERLRDWLDPDQTGQMRINAIENAPAGDLVDVQGIVRDPLGRPIRNVMVRIQGSMDDTVMTGTDGQFILTGINRNGQYTFTPQKTNLPLNGLNALDLVGMQKHLLAKDTFDFAWQHIAADPTNGGTITVGDIVMVLKLLLGQTQVFPTSPSWRFSPPSISTGMLPAGQPVNIEMTGIKIGDVNGTADPQL